MVAVRYPMNPAPRELPSAREVHRFWTVHHPRIAFYWFNQCDPGEPSCYACGWWNCSYRGSEFTGLERSHLVDRCFGGSDDASNLVLLCRECNRRGMPSFKPGQKPAAIGWVRQRAQCPIWLVYSDGLGVDRQTAFTLYEQLSRS